MNKTVGRISMGGGILALSIGLFASFDLKADDTGPGTATCPAPKVSKAGNATKNNDGTITVVCDTPSGNTTCCMDH